MSKQTFIDQTLQLSLNRIAEEVGALLGQNFDCASHKGRFVTTVEYLATRQDRAALTHMSISGERESTAYIVLPLGSAIVLGATLILLPAKEIAARRKKFDFDGEVADAFGEIANIIAGVYTSVFLEKFSNKTHFKKSTVAPLGPKEGAPPEQTLAEAHFYISQSGISLDGEDLGTMEILIPCEVLGLTPPVTTTEDPAATATSANAKPGTTARTTGAAPAGTFNQPPGTAAARDGANNAPKLVLIMADQSEEGEQLAAPLQQEGFETRILALQDSIREVTEGRRVAGVFVLLREVGDRQLSALIKAQSALGTKVPLVAGGAGWTRNSVLQAVKYGARDILVTPAEPEEVIEKARAHMAK